MEEDFSAPIVLKIGGSLIQPERVKILKQLCRKIDSLANDFNLNIVPGGGLSADLVRRFDNKINLTDSAAHFAAILAMEQNSYILQNLFNKAEKVVNIDLLNQKSSGLNLFYPIQHFIEVDPLPHSWNVTSDSIALYLAQKINSKLLILLKDVDGAYDTKLDSIKKDSSPLSTIDIQKLAELGIVDDYFSDLYSNQHNLKCWIINGLYPDRLYKLLKTGKTKGTEVLM